MAVSKQLPPDVLSVVADQIGERFEPVHGESDPITPVPSPPPPHAGNLAIGETFEVWKLIPDAIEAIADGERDIDQLARRSGLWHHQVRRNHKPIGFARARPLGPNPSDWSVREIFTSELATQIDEAISKIDQMGVPDEIEVRLLSIPKQQVEAFWFASDNLGGLGSFVNKMMVIRSPTRILEFEFLKVLDGKDFLAALVTENRGMGIRSK